jgi:hypothetical protein
LGFDAICNQGLEGGLKLFGVFYFPRGFLSQKGEFFLFRQNRGKTTKENLHVLNVTRKAYPGVYEK